MRIPNGVWINIWLNSMLPIYSEFIHLEFGINIFLFVFWALKVHMKLSKSLAT